MQCRRIDLFNVTEINYLGSSFSRSIVCVCGGGGGGSGIGGVGGGGRGVASIVCSKNT